MASLEITCVRVSAGINASPGISARIVESKTFASRCVIRTPNKMKLKLKLFLHTLAIRNGWYKIYDAGRPLDIAKTVFGVWFFVGIYKPMTTDEIFSYIYQWGVDNGLHLAVKDEGTVNPECSR